MNKDDWLKYAPWLVVIFAFFMQYHCFVTPAELKDTKFDIVTYMTEHYATKEQHGELEKKIDKMQVKIDKIYDIVTTRR